MAPTIQISRRTFLRDCAAIAAATGLPMWFVERELDAFSQAPAVTSPNDRPGVALIGCGGMGRSDANSASRFGNIVAVCDADESHAAAAAKQFTKEEKVPAQFTDFRKVLEHKDVDIIVQATPDHWHTLVNLAAAKAKKDIYAEKPLTLTIDEGKRMVKAVRQQRVVLQTGTQQRSHKLFRLACELARNGRIGTLTQVTVWVPAGLREGPFQAQTPPDGFHWDLWLGQAPKVDYLKERTHGTFRWWFDYSGGPVTDWGAHHNDVARWAIGLDGPTTIEARATIDPIPGGFTTPPQFEATLKWANGVTQLVKTTPDDSPYGVVLNKEGQRNGVKLEGTSGWIWVNRGTIEASDPALIDTPMENPAVKLEVSNDHMANFFEAVRSRKDPVSPVEAGHKSAIVGHLIVIALRTGKRLEWNPVSEKFVGEGASDANAHLSRKMRKPYDYGFA
ncbi:MAG TPA: Gfo/Idh/MocA family oxidoreductase [Vicinamibacterales bacterium]|jgi:predicted dehydrogenase